MATNDEKFSHASKRNAKRVVEKGTRLEAFDEEIEIEVGGEKCGRIKKDGTLEWFGGATFQQDVQMLGKQVELWQDVIRTGDNLISLNDNITDEKPPPYAGIEVNRGDGRSSSFLIWAEDEKRWEVVIGGDRKSVMVDENIHSGRGIEVEKEKSGPKIHQVPMTSTHNFWVSNEVVQTRGTDREILPAFISCGDHERKRAKRIRCRLSSGRAEIFFLKNGNKVGDSIEARPETTSQIIDEPLEDGDLIGIGVGETQKARNLSVSVTVETNFSE